jgi:ArsR family transcriptional regulator
MELLPSDQPSCDEGDHLAGRHLTAFSDQRVFEQAARIFRALGDPPRLRLLALLLDGEACVTDLALASGDNLSTVSQRLRVLRSERIVVSRRAGKHINYALADAHVAQLVLNVLGHADESSHGARSAREE